MLLRLLSYLLLFGEVVALLAAALLRDSEVIVLFVIFVKLYIAAAGIYRAVILRAVFRNGVALIGSRVRGFSYQRFLLAVLLLLSFFLLFTLLVSLFSNRLSLRLRGLRRLLCLCRLGLSGLFFLSGRRLALCLGRGLRTVTALRLS